MLVGDADNALAEVLAEAGYEVSRAPSLTAVDSGGDAIVITGAAVLRELAEKKRVLAQLVVHDLRNPLTAVQGNIGLIDECLETRDRVVDRALRDLAELAEHTLSLVSRLLDVDELEEGLLVARPIDVDVAALLGKTSRHQRSTIEFRQLSIEVEAPAGLTARFDPHLIGRVVENLVDNGCRYAPRGGRIVLGAALEGDELVISVSNSGPEIPAEARDRIFDRFFQVEARRESARANRGLGLYFCRLAADAHGGTIAAVVGTEALPGRFEIRLPQR